MSTQWGTPPPPKPKRAAKEKVLLAISWMVAGLIVIAAVGAIAGGGDEPAAPAAPARADGRAPAAPPAATEPATTEDDGPVRTTVGHTLEFLDILGNRSADIGVVEVKTSKGDQFLAPDGVYVGFYISMHSYQDTIAVPDFYARVDGRRYEQTFTTGFEPGLVSYEANAGETVEGWVVFDLPEAHGELVMQEVFENTPQAVWEF